MSLIRGTKTVTSGLILALDAADKNSYPGSGTTWRDLSSNNRTGTLTNGPTFSASNLGNIAFDGINQYASLGTFTGFGTSNRTLCCWANSTATASSRRVVTFALDDSATDQPNSGIQLQNNTAAFFWGGTPYNGNITVGYTNGTWVFLTLTITSGQVGIGYANGVSVGTATSTGVVATNPICYLGRYNANYGQYFQGRLSTFLVYNRVLSASEVLQNYNATKYRFGL